MILFKNLIDINYYQISLFHNRNINKIYENLIDLYQNNDDTIDFGDIFNEITKIGDFERNF